MLNRRSHPNDCGQSPLDVLVGLVIMGFVGAILVLGAKAMVKGTSTAALQHQMDKGRNSMQVIMTELSDAGPEGGICVDPADNPLSPITPVSSCRSSNALPFQLVSATPTQVCFYGRASDGTAAPTINPDRVCIAVFADTFLVKRWTGNGTWTTPSHEPTEIQASVLGGLDSAQSIITYFDANGVNLGIPTPTELDDVALVEFTAVFVGPESQGSQTVEMVFVAPIRANLFAAGD